MRLSFFLSLRTLWLDASLSWCYLRFADAHNWKWIFYEMDCNFVDSFVSLLFQFIDAMHTGFEIRGDWRTHERRIAHTSIGQKGNWTKIIHAKYVIICMPCLGIMEMFEGKVWFFFFLVWWTRTQQQQRQQATRNQQFGWLITMDILIFFLASVSFVCQKVTYIIIFHRDCG